MSNIRRGLRITSVALRYRLDLLIPDKLLGFWGRLLLLPARLFRKQDLERGERLRLALQELGPVFVKLGQMLSTRPDLLPDDIAAQLSELQDKVEPFGSALAIEVLEKAYGEHPDAVFAQFDAEPLASASIAQVHTATLRDAAQSDVVVKVVRPGIADVIEQDLKLMFFLARLVERYVPDSHRLRPVEVISEYEHVIGDELNMQLEAANTSQLKRNFDGSELLYVPAVYWDYVRPNVLVMERVYGVVISDMSSLRAANTDLKVLAERGVEIFFSQVFRDSFFHADMHPGNIFVDVSNPASPNYIALDCAIIGSLDENDLYYLARNLLAIFQRDYRTVADMHIESGWVPEYIRASEFESAIRSVCEPIFEKPLAEISFGQILLYLFTVARRFEMSVQPNLVLLQKTLLAIEGLGRQLYPQLDLWDTAQPFLEKWIEERYAPGHVLQRLQRQAPSLLEQLPVLPELLLENLRANGQRRDDALRLELGQLQQDNAKRQRRRTWIGLGFIGLSAVSVLGVSSQLGLGPGIGELSTELAALIALAGLAFILG